MSLEEQRRSRFEAHIRATPFYARWDDPAFERDTEDGGYLDADLHGAWLAWNAALDSVEIELPEPDQPEDFGVYAEDDPEEHDALLSRGGAQLRILGKVKAAIAAAGLKVKP